MSIRQISLVWEHSEQKGSALLLLLALADYADDAGYCWPGIATLAMKTRLSDRQVMRLLATLEEAGELVALRKRRTGNKYWLKVTEKYTTARDRALSATCQHCLIDGSEATLHQHHIMPKALGGGDEYENIIVLCDNCRKGLLDAIQREISVKMSHKDMANATDEERLISDTHVTFEVTSRVLKLPQMSHDPSRSVIEPSSKDSAGDGAGSEQSPNDDGWLRESRIEGESTLEDMTQEERAKVASPAVPEALPDATELDWEQVMRRGLKGATLPGDFVADDVLTVCQRFFDLTSNPPPANNKGNGNWRSGAMATMATFHGSLTTLYQSKNQAMPATERQRRLLILCLDLFFTPGAGYDHIRAGTPRSLQSSMPGLIGDLVEIAQTNNLNGTTLPDRTHIQSWITQKDKDRRRRGKRSSRPTKIDGSVRRSNGGDEEKAGRDQEAARQVLASRGS